MSKDSPSQGGSLFPNLLKDQSNVDDICTKPKPKSFFKPLEGMEENPHIDSSPEVCTRPRAKSYVAQNKAKAMQRLKSERKKKENKLVVLSSFSDSDSDFEQIIHKAKQSTAVRAAGNAQKKVSSKNDEGNEGKPHNVKNSRNCNGGKNTIFHDISSEDLFSSGSDVEVIQIGRMESSQQSDSRKQKLTNGGNVQVASAQVVEKCNTEQRCAATTSNACAISTRSNNLNFVVHDQSTSTSSSDCDEGEWELALKGEQVTDIGHQRLQHDCRCTEMKQKVTLSAKPEKLPKQPVDTHCITLLPKDCESNEIKHGSAMSSLTKKVVDSSKKCTPLEDYTHSKSVISGSRSSENSRSNEPVRSGIKTRSSYNKGKSTEMQVELLDKIFFGESNGTVTKKRSSAEMVKDHGRPVGLPKPKKSKVASSSLGKKQQYSMISDAKKADRTDHSNYDVLSENFSHVPGKNNASWACLTSDLVSPATDSLFDEPDFPFGSEINHRKTDIAASSVALESDRIASCPKSKDTAIDNKTYIVKPCANENSILVQASADVASYKNCSSTAPLVLNNKGNGGNLLDESVGVITSQLTDEVLPESSGIMNPGFNSALEMWKRINQEKAETTTASGPNKDTRRMTRSGLNTKRKVASATVTAAGVSTTPPKTNHSCSHRAENGIVNPTSAACACTTRNSDTHCRDHEISTRSNSNGNTPKEGSGAQDQLNSRSSHNMTLSEKIAFMLAGGSYSDSNGDEHTAGHVTGSNLVDDDVYLGDSGSTSGYNRHDDGNNTTDSSTERTTSTRSGYNPGGTNLPTPVGLPGFGDETIYLSGDEELGSEPCGATGVMKATEQLESDEAMARRLQEEMDLEFAQHVQQNPITPQARPRPDVPAYRPHDSAGNNGVFERICAMGQYQWDVHKSVFLGQDIPDRPHGEPERELDDLLESEVLEYLETRSPGSVQYLLNERPSLPSRGHYRRRRRHSPSLGALSRTVATEESTSESVRTQAIFQNLTRLGGLVFPETTHDGRHHDRLTELLTRTPNRTRDEIPEIVEHLNSRSNDGLPVMLPTRPSRRGSRRGTEERTAALAQIEAHAESRLNQFYARRNRLLGAATGGYFPPIEAGDDYERLLALGERLGEVRQRGLKPADINRLPTKIFPGSTASSGGGDKNSTQAGPAQECNICCCEYEGGDELRILPCFHNFHKGCIDQWIATNATCPVCRADIEIS